MYEAFHTMYLVAYLSPSTQFHIFCLAFKLVFTSACDKTLYKAPLDKENGSRSKTGRTGSDNSHCQQKDDCQALHTLVNPVHCALQSSTVLNSRSVIAYMLEQ